MKKQGPAAQLKAESSLFGAFAEQRFVSSEEAITRRNASSSLWTPPAGDSGPGAIYGFESEGTSERQSQEAKAERVAGRPIRQYRMHLTWWHLALCVTRASCFFQGETPDFWWGNVSRVPREGLGDFRRWLFYPSGNPNPLKKGMFQEVRIND